MLPIKNRLIKKNDFDAVFKGGKSFKSGFLVFKIIENNLKESRIGFIISKKISNKAVVRNKVKRRLRKIIEDSLKEFKRPIDGIFITMSGIDKIKFEEIGKSVKDILKKAKNV